ncbi:MAG: terminase family protein [Pseudomonadota bacterium]
MRFGASWLASATQLEQEMFIGGLDKGALRALPFLFEFWALPHQLPPEGDWRTWVALGGRGAGKTRAGAEWVRAQVEGSKPKDAGKARRVALIGETYDQARDVMVFGDSGILACSPPDRRPVWEASRRRLVWPNGAIAQVYSAFDPESLRGPQFDAAWLDELAKWPKAEETWSMLQFALRLGDAPRQVVTTTPRNTVTLKSILETPSTVLTHAPTEANRANLGAGFLEEVRARYSGTFLGRQELDGELIDDIEGALWTNEMFERAKPGAEPDRIVVAVDPSVASHGNSDTCGIVVVGAFHSGPPSEWRAVVLEDASVRGMSPDGWSEAVVSAYHRHGADRIVAETNQGGGMVENLIRQKDALVPYRSVHARKGKTVRAEPVAALYEQGRVTHVSGLLDLEREMALMSRTGFQGPGSPDRVDALVWAITDLILEPAATWREPQMRRLG